MQDLVDDLMKYNKLYQNPYSKLACAHLIFPKRGPSIWRFTVDLRPVNKLTARYQFPMTGVENKLKKVSGSSY